MSQNPYQPPESPEEPVCFRATGDTWSGWRKIRQAGGLSFILSILGVFGLQGFKHVSGIDPGWYGSVIFLLLFGGGISLIALGLIGAYVHSFVLMSRGEYD